MPKPTSVQEEIQQTRPFRSKAQEAVVALWRTADQLKAYFQHVVEARGITLQQYNVLRILRGAEPEGLPTLTIGHRMIERSPGITRMIDRLETKQLVRRERRDADRRCVHVRITTEGLDLVNALDRPIDKADDEALGMLNTEDLEELVRILDTVRAHL